MANGIRVDVRGDMRRGIAEFRALEEHVVHKATFRALNRALDRAATETSREIRKVYNVRDRAVKAAMKKRRATKNSLFARLTIEGARIPLIEFAARQSATSRITTVKIKKAGPRKPVRGGFIAASTANNARGGGSMGMQQVWRRVGRARYPIRALRSLSIPQQFANKAVLEAVERATREAFIKNYEQQVRFLGGTSG